MSVALNSGRASALLIALGLAIGGFIWPFISLLGVSQLLVRNPHLINWLALIGGSYLIYLGTKSWMKGIKNNKLVTPTLSQAYSGSLSLSGGRAIQRGLITTLSNPKVAMVWISLSSIIPVTSDQVGWIFIYSIVIALIVFCVYATIACVFSDSRAQAVYLKKTTLVDAIFSTLFILLGIFIIVKAFE